MNGISLRGNGLLKPYLIFLYILSLYAFSPIQAKEAEPSKPVWTTGTAYTMPKGRWEIGLFQPLKYGFKENIELACHPVLFFIMPNLQAKVALKKLAGFNCASQHSFYYPTFLLRLVAREGIGGIISPEFDIPHMVALYNGVVATRPLSTLGHLTFNAGIGLGLGSAPDQQTTIDLPVVFPRMSVFYNHYLLRFGADTGWKISSRWEALVDMDLFIMPGWEETLALEHKGLLIWKKSDHFRILAGYKLTYGQYPFGGEWDFIAPLCDLEWGW